MHTIIHVIKRHIILQHAYKILSKINSCEHLIHHIIDFLKYKLKKKKTNIYLTDKNIHIEWFDIDNCEQMYYDHFIEYDVGEIPFENGAGFELIEKKFDGTIINIGVGKYYIQKFYNYHDIAEGEDEIKVYRKVHDHEEIAKGYI